MKLAIDMISAGSGFGTSTGGMIVYYSGLLSNLCALPSVSRVVPLVAPWNGGMAVPDHEKIRVTRCVGLPRHRAGRVLYEQSVLPHVLNRLDPDVLLSTCNVKPLLWKGRSVVVLQSMQYLHFPTQFGRLRGMYLRKAVGASLHAADAVITVTNWERAEAIRYFDLDPSRVVTVYHGVSDAVRRVQLEPTALSRPEWVGDSPYVLMVSSLYGFKNHSRLVSAFAQIVNRHEIPHRLVLAGGDADVTREDLAALADELGIGDRVVLPGALPHEMVPALIVNADAIAYTSLYETFGHPVLEALALGRPLVTGDHGATAEIAGGAARLVKVEDVDDIAAGLEDVLMNESLRAELIDAGPRRAELFTWSECAENTAAVLEMVLSGRRAKFR